MKFFFAIVFFYLCPSLFLSENSNLFDKIFYPPPSSFIQEQTITPKQIKTRIELALKWYTHAVNPNTNMLTYIYIPSTNTYPEEDNHIRRLGGTWAITKLMAFTKNTSLLPSVHTTLAYYLAFSKPIGNGRYIAIDDAPIAYNAFLMFILLQENTFPNQQKILDELAEGIMAMQQPDGSFQTNFMKKETTGVDYYPGEALLALMEYFKKTQNPKALEAVKRAFPYYRKYWRENKNTAFIPWHVQAYHLLYQYSPDTDVSNFIFEMSDWLSGFQTIKSQKKEYLGGFFSTPSNASASYLEGFASAYALASTVGDTKRKTLYKDVLKKGARYLLQTQYTEKDTKQFQAPEKAIGGFRKSMDTDELRNDYTQHAAAALLSIYHLQIFGTMDTAL